MLDIEDSVKCIICFEFLLAKVLLCEKGHSVCEKCVKEMKVTQCPQCQANLTDSRNYQLEQLIDKIKSHFTIPCSFSCGLKVKLSDMEVHQMECQYRMVACELGQFYKHGCKWKGKIFEIPAHKDRCMQNNYYVMNKKREVDSSNESTTQFRIKLPCQKKMAILIANINGEEKIFYFKFQSKSGYDGYDVVVQHVGSLEKAQQFWFTVTVKNGFYGMGVCENCRSDVKDVSSIVDEGGSIYFPLSYLKKVTVDDRVQFKIVIKMVENI